MIEAEIQRRRVHRAQHRRAVAAAVRRARDAADRRRHHARARLGFGPRSRPRRAAMEDYDRIKALLKGSDMVFITAGEGGGTGTGAAPIVARIARELGALTVGIVTKPFGFEGSRRLQAAEIGIAGARRRGRHADRRARTTGCCRCSTSRRSMVEAFRVADDVLRQGVQGISDLITLPGLINLDFADVRTIMSDAGSALLGIGMGSGDRRAVEAAEQAVASPLLETTLEGARSILLSITGGSRPVAVGGQRGRQGGLRRPRTPTRTSSSARWSTRSSRTRSGSRSSPPATATAKPARRSERRALREPAGEPRRDAHARARARTRARPPRPPDGRRRARVHPAVLQWESGGAAERGARRGRPSADRARPARTCCAPAATPSTPRWPRCSPRSWPSRC